MLANLMSRCVPTQDLLLSFCFFSVHIVERFFVNVLNASNREALVTYILPFHVASIHGISSIRIVVFFKEVHVSAEYVL